MRMRSWRFSAAQEGISNRQGLEYNLTNRLINRYASRFASPQYLAGPHGISGPAGREPGGHPEGGGQ